jgi:two-component system, chemotaxis family, chemotaxis protein CheY
MATILVVDDDSVIRELLAAVLEEESEHHVIVAGNGQEALDQLGTHEVDAMVCDVNMPIMDGLELLRSIRANPDTEDLPVLMLSAAVPADALEPELGVDLMLEKPFEISALLACVSYVLQTVRARAQNVRVTRRRAAAKVGRLVRPARRRQHLGTSPAGG